MKRYFTTHQEQKEGELSHHGIKGQRWGVRRYQNPDGSLTPEGKIRTTARNRIIRAEKTRLSVNDIVNSLSEKDKSMLNLGKDDKEYLTFEQGQFVVKRILLEVGDTPVAYLDFLSDGNSQNGKENLSIATAVRSDQQGKGYGYQVAKQGADWINKHRDEFGYVEWAAKKENKASQRLAEKVGYKHSKLSDDKWEVYRRSKKRGIKT